MEMNKTILTAACALALTSSFALAQPSQGQAGANTGPTSNSANTEKSADTKNGMNNGMQPGMSRDGMSRDGMSTSGANMRDGTNSANPSSSGNVGPGTNNNNTTPTNR
jgi:hypothetical protein